MSSLGLEKPNTTTATPTFLTLPNEILIKISRNLCVRCRLLRIGEVPHEEAVTAPILFHFFHSLDRSYVDTRYRLCRFVCALSYRHDLAVSVRSLVLWTPDHMTPEPSPRAEELASAALQEEEHILQNTRAELGSWWESHRASTVDQLQELAIALAPGVTYVLLYRKFAYRLPDPETWSAWTYPLEGLRHLVLVGWRTGWPSESHGNSYHIQEAQAFLRCARNLESLVAADCGGDRLDISSDWVVGRGRLKAMLWDVELPRLKKLSISGDNIGPEEGGLDFGRPVLDLEMHLGTVKGTLKRLCYSAFPLTANLELEDIYPWTIGRQDESSDDSFDPDWHQLEGFQAGFSLKDFSVLETLELEQLLLYGPVDEELEDAESDRTYEAVTTDEFLSKFPPSLGVTSNQTRVSGPPSRASVL
ncbi:hypothetical protein B0J18DRAFT_479205 [Chaetomium sp. MPI-SDFR-AT-0129]|nr:hypothetical protein B0J18DRAFT_479205 [Chaetomium sp. MPI-SDFR-AT-0129]